jgi:hypothetical protein
VPVGLSWVAVELQRDVWQGTFCSSQARRSIIGARVFTPSGAETGPREEGPPNLLTSLEPGPAQTDTLLPPQDDCRGKSTGLHMLSRAAVRTPVRSLTRSASARVPPQWITPSNSDATT